jgi:recombination protein RecA
MGQRVSQPLSTGWLGLDLALGGGLPPGSLVEVCGGVGSGKTSLGLCMAAAAQQRGGWVAWIAGGDDPPASYVQACGVDLLRMVLARPTDLEIALDMLERLVDSAAFELVIFDGLDALPSPRRRVQPDWYSDDAYATSPVSLSLRRLYQRLMCQDAALVITHIGPGGLSGVPTNSPSYHKLYRRLTRLALPLMARTRLQLTPGQLILSGPTVIGQNANLSVIKNPTKPYHQTLSFDIMYSQGVRRSRETFDLALQLGVICHRGNGFTFEQRFLGETRQNVIDLFDCCEHRHPIEQALRRRLLLD